MLKNLPKMFLGISLNFYLLCSPCSLLCLYYAPIGTKLNVLLEYLQYKNRSIYAFQCILNVLLECIEMLNTVQCILYVSIVLLENINLMLAHYASIICQPIML